jgi:hypothetical protein
MSKDPIMLAESPERKLVKYLTFRKKVVLPAVSNLSEFRTNLWNMETDFHKFVRGYLTAMFWSTTMESAAEGDSPLDSAYDPIDDISDTFLIESIMDCGSLFYDMTSGEGFKDADYIGNRRDEFEVNCYAGQDFWLSRAGHGAGFWDGDWEEAFTEKVEALIKAQFPNVDPYVGDDGKIYAM